MRNQIVKLMLFLILLVFVFGCKKTSKSKFIPPKDGKVTEEMAKRYVKVSVALTKIAESEAVKLGELRKKYGISPGMTELNDNEYKEKHPEVVAAWESLREDWERKHDSVYKALDMREEEWDWIASAIISRENRDIRSFIEKEFERVKNESDSLSTHTIDTIQKT
jgi:alkylhydroperoxidase/carboxymuconolactone decarboxylase family protein YurZ